jgi:tetrapyrrole methylase family protein/MazG family protein
VAGLPRVVIVGLGPAGPELLTVATVEALARIRHRFLRTARHPAASAVHGATTFDGMYDVATSLEEVYESIVEALVDAATVHGEVIYAVPGSPVVAERAVELLRGDHRIAVEVLPALSFLDLAWDRLGVDPISVGARVVDGRRFAVEAAGERGPLLVGQCDQRRVLSDIKLSVEDGPPVIVLQRLGLPDELVTEIAWEDLDRDIEPDHLTSVFIPVLAAPVAVELTRFVELVRKLRAECPWDREQTHASLSRHLLEESYEVLEALDHLDVRARIGFDELEEELGDLLFQVVFHATLAAEEGAFTLADVATTIHDKLVHRHPHVFGEASADDLPTSWEHIKKAEKGRASVMDGIPAALPALLYALKVQKKAAAIGLEWQQLVDGDEAGIGQRLFALVAEARDAGADPETLLRAVAVTAKDRASTHG